MFVFTCRLRQHQLYETALSVVHNVDPIPTVDVNTRYYWSGDTVAHRSQKIFLSIAFKSLAIGTASRIHLGERTQSRNLFRLVRRTSTHDAWFGRADTRTAALALSLVVVEYL
jgi:hypothetical protein